VHATRNRHDGGTRQGTIVAAVRQAQGENGAGKCDEAVQVSLYGFGQHEISDLRASSPPCGGHYVVELRFGASLIVPLGLHRSTPSHSAPRASRSSPVFVAVDVPTS
jgi:hypothetical protein